jgi:hypothetical protein
MRYFVNRDDVEWRDVGDELLVLELGSATYFSVNDSGIVLWNALLDGATKEELVAQLMKEFDVDDAGAKAAVDEFVDELNGRGLLREESS